MEKYHIEATKVTPLVVLDFDNKLFELKGKSSPENASQFYNDILGMLDQYGTSESDNLTANIDFDYFNTSSSKCLFDIFKKLDDLNEAGKSVEVNWFYEEWDDDMLEAAEDYSEMVNINFNIQAKDEED